MNANLIDDGKTMKYFRSVNLGMAVDTERGLMVPTIHDADLMSLSELCTEAKRLAKICQEGKATPDMLSGASFTVSNVGSLYPGMRGELNLLEIISGQVCAIGISAAQDKPLVVTNEKNEKEIAIRKTLGFCIAFDHRAIDFNDIIPFIKHLDGIFANPEQVLEWLV